MQFISSFFFTLASSLLIPFVQSNYDNHRQTRDYRKTVNGKTKKLDERKGILITNLHEDGWIPAALGRNIKIRVINRGLFETSTAIYSCYESKKFL